MTDLVVTEEKNTKPSLFNLEPDDMVAYAGRMATSLKSVIQKQNLYTMIQGKAHVRVEGWTTLGMMLGVLPVEDWVKEHDDGSFEAKVSLVRQSDGRVMGAASALCGVEEKRWGKADRNARRSMAITRATGKAYRLGFSWVMSLAGYEPTPYEEMPQSNDHADPTSEAFPWNQVYYGWDNQKKFLMTIFTELEIGDKEKMKTYNEGCKKKTFAEAKKWIQDQESALNVVDAVEIITDEGPNGT